MSECHHHHHHNHQEMRDINRSRLKIAFALNAGLCVAEIFGGFISKSLALIAEAGHMFTDVFSIGLAIFASYYVQKKLHQGKHSQAEEFSALINGFLLVLTSFWIMWEAYQRIGQPIEILGGLMLWVAIAGLVANILGAFVLHDVQNANVNMKGVYLHLVYDALSSVGVIVAALVVLYTDFLWVDTLVSFVIAMAILKGSISLILKSYKEIKQRQ